MRQVLPWVLASVVLGSVGQFMLKLGARRLGSLSLQGRGIPASLLRLAETPYVWVGIVLFAVSMVMWIKVLTSAPLGTAYPLVSLSYVFVLLLSWAFLGEAITLGSVAGIAAIMLGVALLVRGG